MMDRTWFNTLVDDDGSNLTGTLWNKAAVLALINAIDARVQDWIDVPFNAANFVGGPGMVWTVDAADVILNRYVRIGNLMVWSIILTATTTSGTAADAVFVAAPTGITFASNVQYELTTLPANAYCVPSTGSQLQIGHSAGGGGGPWPIVTNGMYVYARWIGQVI